MQTNVIVIDDFYGDPDAVREYALGLPFEVEGNYPGFRTTGGHIHKGVKAEIQKILQPVAGEVTSWGDEADIYSGAFQYTTAFERSWVHCDHFNNWAGVLFLTPDAPVSAGTGLFKHIPTGLISRPEDKDTADRINADGNDMTLWEMHSAVGNIYNRLVLYRGDLYHRSLDYFGKTKETGRLFQVFFFNTEY